MCGQMDNSMDTHPYTEISTAEKIDTNYCGLHCGCHQGPTHVQQRLPQWQKHCFQGAEVS